MSAMNHHLEFKDKNIEERYKKYNLQKREGILLMQRGAVGLFSFLGVFHLIYLQPIKKDFSPKTEVFLAISSIGILFSIFLGCYGYCGRLRHKDWVIFLANMIINIILIEPNFLQIAEIKDLSRGKYFWLGFRISSINLITLMCYNSFFYKILQTGLTIIYLMIRMRDETSLHNLLVDSSIGVLICIFFYHQEKGERMTFYELNGTMLQKEIWNDFLNFLPDGIAIFSNDYNCVFTNENVQNIFNTTNLEDFKSTILNLRKNNSGSTEGRNSNLSDEMIMDFKLKDQFHLLNRHKKFHYIKEARGLLTNSNEICKNSLETEEQEKINEVFFSEHKGKYLNIKLTPFYYNDSEAILVFVSDITVSIKSQILVLEENKKFRDMLFSSFSHEIRTPLNCILLLLGKLIKGKSGFPESLLKKYIYPSYYSGLILLHLVNNILDYSFLLREDLILKISEINIIDECLEVMEIISIQAQLKGISLILKVDQALPEVIKTDSSRLKQILCHLLLNAMKFTYEGKITLKIARAREFKNGIALSIKDTGIGMSKEEQNRLKEKLHIGSFSSAKVTENAAGASLKTLLSQSLATVIGFPEDDGLKFRSKLKKGTQFRFIIRSHNETESDLDLLTKYKTKNQIPESAKEEKLKSGIILKWISNENFLLKDYSHFISSTSREPFSTAISSSQFIRFNKTSFSNTFMVDPLIKKSQVQKEDQESIFTEKNEETPIIPDFQRKKAIRADKNSPPKNISFPKNIEINEKCSHPKILVVDDDELNIYAVKSILKQKGFAIDSVRNGEQSIKQLHEEVKRRIYCCNNYRLILMDLNMPVMGGLEATRILKKEMKEHKLPWIPIVGCTAFVGSTDESVCRENGMDDYETKPLNEKKLARLLQTWVKSE